MSFGDLMRKTWSGHHLFSVMLELTYRCNLNCFYCYNDLSARGEPLSTEQYLELLRELADMSVMNLSLTGGEPLAHPDFLRIGGEARRLGFVVRIKSNGHAFCGSLARRIRDQVDPFMVDVSLHGARAESHDRQTRIPGSFERLMVNLREMLDLGFRVKLNATLTRWNEGEVEGMYALADALGLRLQVGTEVSPRDDGDTEPLAISATREGVRRLLRINFERARRLAEAEGARALPPPPPSRQEDDDLPVPESDKHCGAGSSTLSIDPFGNVYPCVQWRRPVGNLHERSIGEIWRGSARLEEVRELNREVKRKISALGDDGRRMGFCPGSAELNRGSPLAVYEAAEAQAAVLGEVEAERRSGRVLLPVVR